MVAQAELVYMEARPSPSAQVGSERLGEGSMSWRRTMAQTLEGANGAPRVASSP